MKRYSLLVPIFFVAVAVAGWAQSPAAAPAAPPPQPQPPIVSPEVQADRTVTFRFRDPNAKEVLLSLEGTKPQPMQKDDQGVWSITSAALEPDYYGYSFVADGVNLTDPSNSLMKTNLLFQSNMVHVPGATPEVWDTTEVPHGVVHHYFYHSAVVGDDRDYFVYTPPGYDPASDKRYPVLYLQHGYSDGADGWTTVGRANFILDNLIAQGKAKPMLAVMSLGYGAPEILTHGAASFRRAGLVKENMDKFGQALITEVIPQVEQNYHVISDRSARALAGLSMGGAESLYVGLNHLDHFAWIAPMSAAIFDDPVATFPRLDQKQAASIKLLWIACGKEDDLVKNNRQFKSWLASRNIKFESIETEGAHTWQVWRRNLSELAPLLFK